VGDPSGDAAAELVAGVPKSSSTAGGAGDGGGSDDFACVQCLLASDLKVIADTERELSRLGRFLPVYDVIPAYEINAGGLVGGYKGGRAGAWRGLRGVGRGGWGKGAERALKGPHLSDNDTIWESMSKAWDVYAQDGGGLAGLGAAMKFMGEEGGAGIGAVRHLKLRRHDYVVSAWLRLRKAHWQQLEQEGAVKGSAKRPRVVLDGELKPVGGGTVVELLNKLTSICHL
jgi:hypothetical protein